MTTVILLAAGNGTRIKNSKTPKQYIEIKERAIIEHTVTSFSLSKKIEQILVVVKNEDIEYTNKLLDKYKKVKGIIPGGKTRIWSAYNAVNYLSTLCSDKDKIIISDGVRPFILQKEISELINSLDEYDCVTTGIQCYETLIKSKENKNEITNITPKDNIYRQTSPEGYIYDTLKTLYINVNDNIINNYKNIGIDQLFQKGHKVKIIPSSPLNIKITTQEDIFLLEGILKSGLFTALN